MTDAPATDPGGGDPRRPDPLTAPSGLPPLPTLAGPLNRRVPPRGARREWVTARVVDVRAETAGARSLRLRLPAGAETHVPGQHYVVRMARADGSWAQRSYSIASAPGLVVDGRPHVELTVERLDGGELSPALVDLGAGAQVSLRGPFGGWFLWRGDTDALLVGGGSGVVPLMSMLRTWRGGARRPRLRLVVSVRSPADLYYRDELLGAPEVTVVHTRQAPPGDRRPAGRLDVATLAPLLIPDATCYVCGSAGFAEHASQLLVDLGVPAGAVRVERFGPS